MMIAEMSFRKLDAPELVAKVVDGTRYEDGIDGKGSSAYGAIDYSTM